MPLWDLQEGTRGLPSGLPAAARGEGEASGLPASLPAAAAGTGTAGDSTRTRQGAGLMPRLSRALATLPQIFEPVQAGDDFVQPLPNGLKPVLRVICAWCQGVVVEGTRHAGISHGICAECDRRLAQEEGGPLSTVARAIAGGDLAGAWQLGVIGARLTSGEGR